MAKAPRLTSGQAKVLGIGCTPAGNADGSQAKASAKPPKTGLGAKAGGRKSRKAISPPGDTGHPPISCRDASFSGPNTLLLPYPPSTNRMWTQGRGGVHAAKELREFKAAAQAIFLQCADCSRIEGDVEVNIVLRPRMTLRGQAYKRRMDIDNCIKAVLDALNMRAYDDDAQVVRVTAEVGGAIWGGGVYVKWGRA